MRQLSASSVGRHERFIPAASQECHVWHGITLPRLVIAAALIAWRYAVDAECNPLEQVAPPLGAKGEGATSVRSHG